MPADDPRLTNPGVAIAVPTTIALSVVGQWFDRKKGLATGCVTLGAPLGGIFFSLVLQILFDRYPWKTAALVLAAIMAVFLLLGFLLVETNPPAPAAAHEVDKDDSDSNPEPLRLEISHMLRSPKFWLLSYALFGEYSLPPLPDLPCCFFTLSYLV